MPRLKREKAQKDEWCEWVTPVMKGYRMACCDCGLVHNMDFIAVKVLQKTEDGFWKYKELDPDQYRIIFRGRRNNRSTAQVRRHMKGAYFKPLPKRKDCKDKITIMNRPKITCKTEELNI